MKSFLLLFICLFFTIILSNTAFNQEWMPVLRNELGDTIHYEWPIPDSILKIKDEIIIKFKKNALNLETLCYFYYSPSLILEGSSEFWYNWYSEQKADMMSEQFPVDSIIVDSLLLNAIKEYGGTYLTRITAANPCTDTLSITRFGDTVPCANYLWMTLKLDNDTSVINTCVGLTIGFQNSLDIAEPNYCGVLNATPIDTYYGDMQESLHPFYTDIEGAWNYQQGSSSIKVGIIDTGIDYTHCDLGGQQPPNNKKVVDGWNYTVHSPIFRTNSFHGTWMAGFIGALTNGSKECPHPGIAGIAGGWLSTPPDWENDNLGCELYGFKVNVVDEDENTVEKVLGAIFDASSSYTTEYEKMIKHSFGVHILNCSWGYDGNFQYYLSLQNAFNFAFEQGVSIVCSRGNIMDRYPDPETIWYPACFEPSWITSVGGHDDGNWPEYGDMPQQDNQTFYGTYTDFLGPSRDYITYTTKWRAENDVSSYERCGGTSAAAAHTTGAIALLRSDFLKDLHPANPQDIEPEPEDFENMLKAAALDLNYDPENEDPYQRTEVGYDNITGWGQLKVGKLFELIYDYDYDYVLKHYIITNINTPPDFTGETRKIKIVKNGIRDDCQPGFYKVRERTVTGTIELEDEWQIDEEHNLYVWGRNGRTTKGGIAPLSDILYLTSYTEVTSGDLGNGWIPGIVHNNLTVNAKTYQHELNDIETNDFLQNLPLDDNIEMYISVFGKPKGQTSVYDNYQKTNSLHIYPNPATNKINLKVKIDRDCSPVIEIYNTLGNIVYLEHCRSLLPGENNKSINVSELPVGVYTLSINYGNSIISKKIVIIR